ncbi:hypothetical protein KKB18_05675, partial [bacterium]|nr:hypothetical protein [bacterium]
MRITEGKPIYIPPDNPDFIPYVYTPLYFYFIGYLGKIFGLSFALARFVSFLSALGSGILIFSIIKKETENLKASFIGFAIFFSAYAFTGYWYDIVRSDSLFVFFLLLGCYLMRFKNCSTSMLIMSSFVLTLSFFTKQPAYYFIGLCSLMFLFTFLRKTVILYAFSLIFAVGGIFCANYLTSGFFWFYIFKLCVGSVFNLYLLPDLLKNYILKGISFMILILAIFLFKNLPYVLRFIKSPKVIWLLGFAAGFLSFLSTMVFGGGYLNGLIPLVCFSSICVGLAYHYLSKSIITKIIAIVLLILQLAFFSYDPRAQIPTKSDYELGERFIGYISKIPSNEVLVFKHSYYPVM